MDRFKNCSRQYASNNEGREDDDEFDLYLINIRPPDVGPKGFMVMMLYVVYVTNPLRCQRKKFPPPASPERAYSLTQKRKLPSYSSLRPNWKVPQSQNQHMRRLVYQFPSLEGAETRKDEPSLDVVFWQLHIRANNEL